MAKQTIGVGTTADDGTGDTLRAAFVKVNANTTELYDFKDTPAEIADVVGLSAELATRRRSFATRTAMLAATFTVGEVVETRGLLTEGDKGQANFIVRASDPANNRSWESSDNKFLDMDPAVNGNKTYPEQYGTITGTNSLSDTTVMKAALLGCASGTKYAFERSPLYLIEKTEDTRGMLELWQDDITLEWSNFSTLKVADAQGEYQCVFGPDYFHVSVDKTQSWTFINPRVDKNSRSNPLTLEQAGNTNKGRHAITNIGTEGRVHGVMVKGGMIWDEDAVVSILIVGRPAAIGDTEEEDDAFITIDGTHFKTVLNSNITGDYDQSTINVMGFYALIKNCVFEGESWARAPRAAVETHAAPIIMRDNTVTKYQVALNVTSSRRVYFIEKMIDISDNHFEVTEAGIYLWSFRGEPTQPNDRMIGSYDFTIQNNKIYIRWKLSVVGSKRLIGIGLYKEGYYLRNYDDVIIKGNYIRYDREYPRWRPSYAYAIGDRFIGTVDIEQREFLVTVAATSGAAFDSTEQARYTNSGLAIIALDRAGSNVEESGAIRFQGVVGDASVRHYINMLQIVDNTVVDAPCKAVRLHMVNTSSAIISNNIFRRCGTASIEVTLQNRVIMDMTFFLSELGLVENNKIYPQGKGNNTAMYFNLAFNVGKLGANNNIVVNPVDGSIVVLEPGTKVVDSKANNDRSLTAASAGGYGGRTIAVWPSKATSQPVLDRTGATALTIDDMDTPVKLDGNKILPVGTYSDVGKTFKLYNSSGSTIEISPVGSVTIDGGNVTIASKKWASFVLSTPTLYLPDY